LDSLQRVREVVHVVERQSRSALRRVPGEITVIALVRILLVISVLGGVALFVLMLWPDAI
jgi:hypothetical protein